MRTSIDIDRDLADEVMRVLGVRTLREAVDRSLREVVARRRRLRAAEKHFQAHDFELPPDDPALGFHGDDGG